MLTKSDESVDTTTPGARTAVEARGVSKRYMLYPSARHQVMDLLGVYRAIPRWQPDFPEYSALEDVSLSVSPGERIGIIGRNGAGKTTLLKLISGTLDPTSGTIKVNGDVQALMQVGVGFHPEFTGLENIRASLLYSGLSGDERKAAEADVIEFCELGDFLGQPLKTYSLGMQSRLQFACATSIKPEILIVDEILGAGDAYFSAKSAQRMKKLTSSGCTLLLVSHSMGQIMQFCDQAIWIEQGQIAAQGKTREIVNRYEKFIHELRQKAKITEADQLSNANQSDWLKEITLEAFQASQSSPGSANETSKPAQHINRWPQDGSPIEIASVHTRDHVGDECSLFQVGQPIMFEITIKALKEGEFPCRYCIVVFTSDGRLVTRHVSGWFKHKLVANETRVAQLRYDASLLGTGNYFFSVAAYERLNLRNMTEYRWYDLHTRAYDFTIAEDAFDPVSLIHHPNRWMLIDAPRNEAERHVGADFPQKSNAVGKSKARS